MRPTKYPKLKSELKKLAKEIRYWKANRKLDKRIELKMLQDQVQDQVDWRKDDFRHKHIAYCMLRGRTYEQIENYCRVAPDFDRIDKILEEYGSETLCAGA
jgi:hypothetical protein